MTKLDVLILIGPNGVGKTTIGRLLGERFWCHFMSVEEFFMEHYPTVEQYWADKDSAYERFEALVRKQRAELNRPIVFEEVGLSVQSQRLIANLQKDLDVSLIKVVADKALCAKRVLDRGLTSNYPKNPKMLHEVYQRFVTQIPLLYRFDGELVNDDLPVDVICDYFGDKLECY